MSVIGCKIWHPNQVSTENENNHYHYRNAAVEWMVIWIKLATELCKSRLTWENSLRFFYRKVANSRPRYYCKNYFFSKCHVKKHQISSSKAFLLQKQSENLWGCYQTRHSLQTFQDLYLKVIASIIRNVGVSYLKYGRFLNSVYSRVASTNAG